MSKKQYQNSALFRIEKIVFDEDSQKEIKVALSTNNVKESNLKDLSNYQATFLAEDEVNDIYTFQFKITGKKTIMYIPTAAKQISK